MADWAVTVKRAMVLSVTMFMATLQIHSIQGPAGGGYFDEMSEANFEGGNGGGVVNITVSGSLILDGRIMADADGSNYEASGGAGGSIKIITNSFCGNGLISNLGGDAGYQNNTCGGGGGRIAVYYDTLDCGEIDGFELSSIQAFGGSSENETDNGGAGTIYVENTDTGYTSLTVNNDFILTSEFSTPIITNGTTVYFDELVIQDRGAVEFDSPVVLSEPQYSEWQLLRASLKATDLVITNASDISIMYSHLECENITNNSSSLLDLNLNDSNMVWLSSSPMEFGNIGFSNGSNLSHLAAYEDPENGWVVPVLDINVNNLYMYDDDSSIDVVGKGLPGGNSDSLTYGVTWGSSGPTYLMGSQYHSGGSYGGLGGQPDEADHLASVYGDYKYPILPGSGGGGSSSNGGSGGGVVRIIATGLVGLEGTINASGADSFGSSAGSGGSINIKADRVCGDGQINANGGNAFAEIIEYGGGAGGRIAIEYGTTTECDNFIDVNAYGGSFPSGNPASTGGAGTTYIKITGGYESLIVDNNYQETLGYSTPMIEEGHTITVDYLSVFGSSRVSFADNIVVKEPNDYGDTHLVEGRLSAPTIKYENGLYIYVYEGGFDTQELDYGSVEEIVFDYSDIRIGDISGSSPLAYFENYGSVLEYGSTSPLVVDVLVFEDSSILTVPPMTLSGQTPEVYSLNLQANYLRIGYDSTIDVTGKGYSGNGDCGYAPYGVSQSCYDVGGSHGGLGGFGDLDQTYQGESYDALNEPVMAGSAGGGAFAMSGYSGGGVIKITAEELDVDGEILADGISSENLDLGAGAGGSIWIITETLSGEGVISASGGHAESTESYDGAGGGGRIAVEYRNYGPAGHPSFFAYGGAWDDGSNVSGNGGAGTIFLKQELMQYYGELVVSSPYYDTPVDSTPIPGIGQGVSDTVSGTILEDLNADYPTHTPLTYLVLNPDTVQTDEFKVAGNNSTHIFVESGSNMDAITTGGSNYTGILHLDALTVDAYAHFYSPDMVAIGPGSTADGPVVTIMEPTSTQPGTTPVSFEVISTSSVGYDIAAVGCMISGEIDDLWIEKSFEPVQPSPDSIFIDFYIPIEATTGNTITIECSAIDEYYVMGDTASLTVTIESEVIINEIQTSMTIAEGDTSFDNHTLVISNGATVTMKGQHTFKDIYVQENGAIVTASASGNTVYGIDITADYIEVEVNAKISADLAGYLGANNGSNTSMNGMTFGNTSIGGASQGTGGSHGGLGGGSSWTIERTSGYGNMFTPSYPGSGGGAYNDWDIGGNGGGTIRLIAGEIKNDGVISADGEQPPSIVGLENENYGGSGAGGSIILDAATISGTGSITAKGGDRANTINPGGGGGGRIAVNCLEYSFTGTILANGGLGSNYSYQRHGGGWYYLY